MNPNLKVLYGILSCGGLGFLAFYLSSKVGTKSKVLESIFNLTSKQKKEKIEQLEKKQNVIKVKLEESIKISKASKEKIQDIQKKAIKDIEKVLTENKVSNIHKEIENDWEDI